MTTRNLELLSAELEKLKTTGHTAVALEVLIPYVNALVAAARSADPEGERQRIELNFEGQVEHYRAEMDTRLEMFKSVIEAGQSALRSLSLLNGAAAIALLAFLGNVLSHPTIMGIATIPGMSRSMACFAIGVGLAACGFVARYFSQASHGQEFSADPATAWKWGVRIRNVAICSALASLAIFFVGVWFAFKAATTLG